MSDEANRPAEAVTEAVEAGNEAAVKAAARTSKKTARKARRAAKATASTAQTSAEKRNDKMTFNPTNMFAGIAAFPGAPAFEKFFTEAAGRGEDAVTRSRKAAEELADIYRGNIDAFVEASRIAATGIQSIGQSVIAKGRGSVDESADTVRSFAEAKSPTELLQLQSDYARSAFDRFVEDSSNLTESLVKLAGEAFQPLSNRASANVERFNQIVA